MFGIGKRCARGAYGEDKDRATYFHRWSVVCGVAIYNRVPAPGFLEGRFRNCVVAVLSWRAFQRAGALNFPAFGDENMEERGSAPRSSTAWTCLLAGQWVPGGMPPIFDLEAYVFSVELTFKIAGREFTLEEFGERLVARPLEALRKEIQTLRASRESTAASSHGAAREAAPRGGAKNAVIIYLTKQGFCSKISAWNRRAYNKLFCTSPILRIAANT